MKKFKKKLSTYQNILYIWVLITANVKRLGFCGVYAQSFFHAIEPNQC